MPYCIQKQADGKFVVLNRDYKPVGFNTSKGISYKEYPIIHKVKGLTPEIAAKISHENDPGLNSIYLYHDGSVPTDSDENMEEYEKRLKLLNQLEVEE
jgi:hypothetical protein